LKSVPSLAIAAMAMVAFASTPDASGNLIRSGGVLGQTADYQLQGDPGEVFILAPSLSQGPTSLLLVDPRDPRLLGVGMDLVKFWSAGVLDGSGNGSVSYPLPPSASLSGIAFFAQFVTLPGTATVVDDISNVTSFRLGLAGKVINTVGNRIKPIDGHTSTNLSDGRILLAGGLELVTPTSGYVLDLFEIFDPQTQTFAQIPGVMQHPRASHSATLMSDGRVMLLGGMNEVGVIVGTGDIFDPATGVNTPIAVMSSPRATHTATLLADGRVFVAGGFALLDPNDPTSSLTSTLSTTEIYDPATNRWQAGPGLSKQLTGHTASLLSNGQVLIAGGIEITMIFGQVLPSITANCSRFDPQSNQLVATAPMPQAATMHAQVTLPNGNALVVGGADLNFISYQILTNCQVYNAGSNSWSSAGNLQFPRAYPGVAVAGSKIVAVGGIAAIDSFSGALTSEPSVESAPLSASGWTSPGNLILTRPIPLVSAFDGGQRVLITGGPDSTGTALDQTGEVFIP